MWHVPHVAKNDMKTPWWDLLVGLGWVGVGKLIDIYHVMCGCNPNVLATQYGMYHLWLKML